MFHFREMWSWSNTCWTGENASLHPLDGLFTLLSLTSARARIASCHTNWSLNEFGMKLMTLRPRKRSTALCCPSGWICEFIHNMYSSSCNWERCLFFCIISLQLLTNRSAWEFDWGEYAEEWLRFMPIVLRPSWKALLNAGPESVLTSRHLPYKATNWRMTRKASSVLLSLKVNTRPYPVSTHTTV